MNPTIRWPDKSLPVAIYCSPGVLRELETLAADGLLAMPRTGLGIGGLLLGSRVKRRIDVLRTVEIPCSHALGPGFVLTAEEIAAAAELPAKEAESAEAVGDALERVGWYWSKPNGQLTMTANDRSVFDALCPERWQVALLIRPKLSQITMASFGTRKSGEGGTTVLFLGTPHELVWDEPEESQADATTAAVLPMVAALPKADALPKEVLPPVPAVAAPPAEPTAPPVPVIPVVPVRLPKRSRLSGPPEPLPETKWKSRWPLVVLAAAAILLMLLPTAAFLTRRYWIPHPVISMVASSDRAGRVWFLWNSEGFFWKPERFLWNPAVLWNPEAAWNSDVLNAEDSAVLVIDDGASAPHTVHLNEAAVRAGWYQYDCRASKVTATLKAGKLSDTVTLTARGDRYLPESGISK
jgi:hypothetical protein